MAELNTGGGGGGKGGKVRSKKQSTRVDLTAMVDLAFLLLSFFILTTTLAKPQAMDVAKPDKDQKNDTRFELKASVTMTALLGKNDKIAYYMGDPKEAKPQITDYNGIRKVLIDESKKVRDKYGDNNPNMRFTVVVKPTDVATYKNFVDMMDEIAVAGVKTAPAIDDDPTHLLEPEKQFMRSQGLY